MSIKIGDRVFAGKAGKAGIAGTAGTVIGHSVFDGDPLVEFDENIDGHDGLGKFQTGGRNGKQGHCWYVAEEDLEVITEELS